MSGKPTLRKKTGSLGDGAFASKPPPISRLDTGPRHLTVQVAPFMLPQPTDKLAGS